MKFNIIAGTYLEELTKICVKFQIETGFQHEIRICPIDKAQMWEVLLFRGNRIYSGGVERTMDLAAKECYDDLKSSGKI